MLRVATDFDGARRGCKSHQLTSWEALQTIDGARTFALMEKVADWQLAHPEPVASIKAMREEARSPRSWQQGAFYAVIDGAC